MTERLAQIRQRCEAATPGPWVEEDGFILTAAGQRMVADFVPFSANSEFMAAARDDVPYLLAEIERLRAEVARLEAKSKALRAECSDLWEVIERTKDALRDYDGICLEGAQGAWEILQGALDEEPNNAS